MPKPIADCVVLYVEDDDATAYLFQIAMRESEFYPQVFRVTDGEQAIGFVLQTGAYQDAPLPDLVLLDLNLPKRSGLEVLAQIRSDSRFNQIPIFVFSTSENPADRAAAEALGATKILAKGDSLDNFAAVAKAACESLS